MKWCAFVIRLFSCYLRSDGWPVSNWKEDYRVPLESAPVSAQWLPLSCNVTHRNQLNFRVPPIFSLSQKTSGLDSGCSVFCHLETLQDGDGERELLLNCIQTAAMRNHICPHRPISKRLNGCRSWRWLPFALHLPAKASAGKWNYSGPIVDLNAKTRET